MGIFGKLFGKGEKAQGANPDLTGSDSSAVPQNSLTEGLEGFSDQPPSFNDDFTRNNFPGDGFSDSGMQNQSGFAGAQGQHFGQPAGMGQQMNPQPEQDNVNTDFYRRQGMEIREKPQGPEGFEQSQGKSHIEKDLEIISSKLDALKSAIENMDQRIRKIEKIAEDDNKQPQRPRW